MTGIGQKLPRALQNAVSAVCCGLNGSTQHFVLDAEDGVYVEESKEPSTFQGGRDVAPLEASGAAEVG